MSLMSNVNVGLPSGRWQPPKMTWWYWALLDEMIANPDLNKKEIADRFRVTPACIYLVTGSDIFKAHLARRRLELSATIDAKISDRLGRVAVEALDITLKVLQKKQDQVPLETLVSVMDKTLSRLGYGVKEPPPSGVTVNVQNTGVLAPISAQDLAASRDLLRRSQEARAFASTVVERPMRDITPPKEEGGSGKSASESSLEDL